MEGAIEAWIPMAPLTSWAIDMGSLRIDEKEGVTIVHLAEAKILDEVKIQKIGNELLSATEQAAAEKKLLLSFRGVGFMSSAMIGKLVLLHKKCKKDGIDLKLCDISSSVAEVFKIMNLTKVFDIHKSEEKGLKAFSKKGWFS